MKVQFKIDIVEWPVANQWVSQVTVIHKDLNRVVEHIIDIEQQSSKPDAIKAARKWAEKNLYGGSWHFKKGVFE